jgi:hypothetical protein
MGLPFYVGETNLKFNHIFDTGLGISSGEEIDDIIESFRTPDLPPFPHPKRKTSP